MAGALGPAVEAVRDFPGARSFVGAIQEFRAAVYHEDW